MLLASSRSIVEVEAPSPPWSRNESEESLRIPTRVRKAPVLRGWDPFTVTGTGWYSLRGGPEIPVAAKLTVLDGLALYTMHDMTSEEIEASAPICPSFFAAGRPQPFRAVRITARDVQRKR
jgi:hypothetical protein